MIEIIVFSKVSNHMLNIKLLGYFDDKDIELVIIAISDKSYYEIFTDVKVKYVDEIFGTINTFLKY
jgi:hypothetical protein